MSHDIRHHKIAHTLCKACYDCTDDNLREEFKQAMDSLEHITGLTMNELLTPPEPRYSLVKVTPNGDVHRSLLPSGTTHEQALARAQEAVECYCKVEVITQVK